MSTDLENLRTRRSAIYAELAALDSTQPGGKPNAAGGESIDHIGYKDALYRELLHINNQIDHIIAHDVNSHWEFDEFYY